jgi:solute carrier family 29 (equilibrative nucleoside transporter), member 1/2/3
MDRLFDLPSDWSCDAVGLVCKRPAGLLDRPEVYANDLDRNMFLAAAPYFDGRFSSSKRIRTNFQSAELSVSTTANLGSMILLTKLQANASYPGRIMTALIMNMVTFTLLALSTKFFLGISAGTYFAFLILMVFLGSLATGFMQNGVFAYVGGLGKEQYTQAIMTGQAVAGILPCIVQIVSVLSVPPKQEGDVPKQSTTSAFVYFLTATGVSAVTLVAFLVLLSRHGQGAKRKQSAAGIDGEEERSGSEPQTIPLLRLFRKLFWLAATVFLTFCVTMLYPVFTSKILSVRPIESSPRFWHPSTFIPLAFLFWNVGDLIGRLLTANPQLSLTSRPRILFMLAIARAIWIPTYYLCNIDGRGAIIKSDFFYLVLVQVLFGLTNGYIGSECMIGFVDWVDADERAAAGGFMSLCLVAGLTAGSLLSFFIGGSMEGKPI